MRIITDLNEPSIEALKWLCDNYKISRAEAIRRAVMEKAEHEMEHAIKRKKEDVLKTTFGAWKSQNAKELHQIVERQTEVVQDWEAA